MIDAKIRVTKKGKKQVTTLYLFTLLVGPTGFEPVTLCL